MNASVPPLAFKGYLLDTSVLSALSQDRGHLLPATFAEWLLQRGDRLFIPCIAVAEIEQGICKLRRAGGVVRAERLTRWLEGLIAGYAERILPLGTQTAVFCC